MFKFNLSKSMNALSTLFFLTYIHLFKNVASNLSASYEDDISSNDERASVGDRGGYAEMASVHPVGVCTTPGCIYAASFILENANLSADPCEDFYEFACGRFLRNTIVTSDYFADLTTLSDRVKIYDKYKKVIEDSVQEMLQKPASQIELDAEWNAINYYRSCLDGRRPNSDDDDKTFFKNLIDDVGGFQLTALQIAARWNQLDPLRWKLEDLLVKSIEYSANSSTTLFQVAIERDLFDATLNSVFIGPWVTFLFNDKTFFDNQYPDDFMETLLTDYTRFLHDFNFLLYPEGFDNSSNHADETSEMVKELFNFEMELAKITPHFEESAITFSIDEDTLANVSLKEASIICPGINWTLFFELLGERYKVTALRRENLPWLRLTIYGVSYFQNVSWLLHEKMMNTRMGRITLQNHVVLNTLANYLPKVRSPWLVSLYGDFANNLANGVPCFTRNGLKSGCLAETKRYYGEILSRNFVERYFPDSTKNKVEHMAEAIRSVFLDRIRGENTPPNLIRWLDPETRSKAERKARSMIFSIGYPSQVKGELEIMERFSHYGQLQPDDYLQNVALVSKGMNTYMFKMLDQKPQRPNDWGQLLPIDQNAEYDSMMNVVHFAAGYSIEPFFRMDFPTAFNWGGIGQALGHEFIHGFDTFGSRFDEDGQLVVGGSWWSDWTTSEFQLRAQCFERQYSTFTPLPGFSVNGTATLNENIADNEGLKLAFRAFKNDSAQSAKLPGVPLTDDQIFFLVTAMNYCEAQAKESIKFVTKNDMHSPARERVNGMMMNSEAFSRAYKCPYGSRLNPLEKCSLF